jgi:F-type H+-transporting ATPase subunit b
MDVILHQLGEILLKAVPTFLIVVFLHFYLKIVFFKPLEKVLHRRYDATEGARKQAEEALARATAKTGEYENAMRKARSEVYERLDQIHKELLEKELAQLAAARKMAESAVDKAKAELAKDVEAAKTALARDSERLANEIADAILRRSAA